MEQSKSNKSVAEDTPRETLMCRKLGLRNEISYWIHELSQTVRYHQTNLYWFRHFVSEKRFKVQKNFKIHDEYDYVTFELMTMGFSEKQTNILARWMLNDIPCYLQQPPLYWILRYLDMKFQYENCPKYPHNNNSIDEWSFVEVDYEDEKDNDCMWLTPIYNTHIDNMDALIKEGNPYPRDDMFFHATDHISASHIMRNGIHLGIGNPQQDFSSGMGFYLTRNYQYALEWAKGFPQRGAVIVYKFTKKEMNKFSGLSLDRDDKTWDDLVRYNRAGQHVGVHRPDRKLRMMYNTIDYIEGPMLGNGFTWNMERWNPIKLTYIDNYQLCILSKRMACTLGHVRYIDSVIFFDWDSKAW